jgi:hypothetical protein
MYYNHVTIVNDDSSFKLIYDPRVVIYDHHRFIIQATDLMNQYNQSKFAIIIEKIPKNVHNGNTT